MLKDGRKKSGDAKAKIEAAASRLFASGGYHRTTVRDIAAAAQIDAAMVIRYFGSKDELFARVAEPSLNLGDLSAVEPGRIGEALVERFLALWEGEGSGGLPILLRSAASNEAAAQRLRNVFEKQVLPAIASVGNPANAPLRAGLVSSHLLGLALCRYVLELPPVVAMDRDTLVREVGATIQHYVTLDH